MNLPLKLRLFQSFSEALLPLLGYFFWNWTFYDLLLFYFLDQLVATTFTFIKIKKVVSFTKVDSGLFQYSLTLILSYITVIFLAIKLLPEMIPSFHFTKDTTRFFMLKDMGIPQGILLLPLVFYAGYLQYKMKFLHLRLAEKITVHTLKKQHLQGLLTIISMLGVALGLCHFIHIPEIVAVYLLILLTGIYSFFWKE